MPKKTTSRTAKSNRTARIVTAEFRVVTLREISDGPVMADCPEIMVEYWRKHIAPDIDSMKEHLVAFLLNTHHRLLGHHVVGIGTLDSVITTPRETFRAAIMKAARCIVLMHNHPSGDARPSKQDIEVTRQMIGAGEVVGIEVLDHIIIGDERRFSSLRGLGYFYKSKRKTKAGVQG